ncbi:MAG: VRR-NUC domain-containing protein [Proteobacteria bacterium]|nr:VRR-NUC domain-containing protein [Pseudomonadota bacterium]
MPQLRPNTPPPPDYYRNNLLRVVEFVAHTYADLLNPRELLYLHSVTQVSRDAQRLLARLISRKGPRIREDRLNYTEVGCLQTQLQQLEQQGLIDRNPAAPADRLLMLCTKDELVAWFPGFARSSKAVLLGDIVTRYSDVQLHTRLSACLNWVSIRQAGMLDLLRLLYFGDSYRDLSAFVLEDLGLVRYEPYVIDRSNRQFDHRDDLDRYLTLRSARDLSHRLADFPQLAAEVTTQLLHQPCETRIEQRTRDRALNRLGHWHERLGELDSALACYAGSNTHPARERSVRILKKTGQVQRSECLQQQLIEAPRCAEEEDFAQRFGKRGGGVKPPITSVRLDCATPERIEDHAAQLLTANGGVALHLENNLPLSLTALAYWPVIFAEVPGAFTNPFQSAPVDLFWPDFARTRATLIAEQDRILADPLGFRRELTSTWQAKSDTANALMSWRAMSAEVLHTILHCIPHTILFSLVGHVIRNLPMARTGFPDLTVLYGPGQYEFVEVKGPTDQLQPAQRIWFKHLTRLGANGRVLKFQAQAR